MKRRITFFIVILVLLLLVSVYFNITMAADLAPDPGSDQDPLVSKSYVDSNVNAQAQLVKSLQDQNTSAQAEISGLKEQITVLKDELEKLKMSGGPGQGYEILNVEAGKVLYAGSGTELVLRAGKAAAVKGTGGGLVDITAGKELGSGIVLVVNHLNISSRDDKRGFKAVTACNLLVKGGYSIENPPAPPEPPKETILGTGVVNASSLNVRASASTTAAIAASVVKNETVTVISKSGDWYRIKTSKGVYGWVLGKYITMK